MQLSKKEKIEAVSEVIKICEERMLSLEKSIKSSGNTGLKSIMQSNYVLNESLYKYYKSIYARLIM